MKILKTWRGGVSLQFVSWLRKQENWLQRCSASPEKYLCRTAVFFRYSLLRTPCRSTASEPGMSARYERDIYVEIQGLDFNLKERRNYSSLYVLKNKNKMNKNKSQCPFKMISNTRDDKVSFEESSIKCKTSIVLICFRIELCSTLGTRASTVQPQTCRVQLKLGRVSENILQFGNNVTFANNL